VEFPDEQNIGMFIFKIHIYICHYLAWLLRMKRPGYDLTWRSIRHRSSSIDSKHTDMHYPKYPSGSISNDIKNINKPPLLFSISRERQQSDSVTEITAGSTRTLQHDHHSSTVLYSYDTNIIRSELRTIISQLANLTNHIWQQEKYDNESQDWKFAAMVIDRLCLILFTIIMAIFTINTFLSIPNFYNLR